MCRRGRWSWPPFDCVIVKFGKADPRGDVGFVVERGDYDFGARGEVEDEGKV